MNADVKRHAQTGAYIAMRITGWISVSVLAALGCFVVFFIMLGNFDLGTFFLQVDNLASRYADADTVRRAGFVTILTQVSLGVFFLVCLFRLGSLLAIFRDARRPTYGG